MYLYNSLTRKIEEFKPLKPQEVNIYVCGLTVYDFAHIGNMRSYSNSDFLKRTLLYLGYKVNHVMNITDVGHLTGDDDSGEDKLEKQAKKTKKTVWEVAEFYTDFFLKTLKELNILLPDVLSKATDHIPEMVAFIKKLEEKGFTYETNEAVYFDVSKFKGYGKLSGQKLEEKLKGAREEVYVDPKKKHPADFALWFKRIGRFANHQMHWESPWGEGFPGWHIECSAMSMKYLGQTIDIHAGGVDHLAVHHEDEIAQSEALTGKQFVNYWFHNNFLLVENQKMSKSLGNFFTIEDTQKKGIDPLALRLLFLQTHYRSMMNFTWDSAKGSNEALNKLKEQVVMLRKQTDRTTLSQEKYKKIEEYRDRFIAAISNDLQTSAAVAIMWEMLKSNVPSPDKLDLLLEFDQVFGLKLAEVEEEKIPEDIVKLAEERQQMRVEKRYEETDRLRKEIESKGYTVEDTPEGFRIKRLK
ncbi:MAG: cysteine--tRNA ligase [Candidatus Roizmanbacteria bacterium]|nr:MAG: cysteine--tRNA ligase [Candidatus Roizmanbacteria bacterium]